MEIPSIDAFISGFKGLEINKPIHLIVNGNYVKVQSGKVGWKTIGDAKAAIKQHFQMMSELVERVEGEGSREERNKRWGNFIEKLVKLGIIKFE